MTNELFELAAKRRSIRRYTNDHISDDVLNEIMKVALAAPCSFGHRPVEFVIVRDKNRIIDLAACKSMGGSQIVGADVIIVVMVKLDRGEFWIEDGAIASGYILLAADALRLLLLLLEMIPFLKDNKIKPSYILPSGVYELASDYLFGREASVDLSKATEGNIEDMIQAVDPNLAKAMLYIVILVGVFIILPLILSQTVFRKKELEF